MRAQIGSEIGDRDGKSVANHPNTTTGIAAESIALGWSRETQGWKGKMVGGECEKPMTSRDSLAYSSSSSSLPSLGRACNSSSSSASCFLLRVDMMWMGLWEVKGVSMDEGRMGWGWKDYSRGKLEEVRFEEALPDPRSWPLALG